MNRVVKFREKNKQREENFAHWLQLNIYIVYINVNKVGIKKGHLWDK